MENILELVQYLENETNVYIQTHNFPDHDAVASAFAMQGFLSHFGIRSSLVYDGVIERDSLHNMIHSLNIDIKNIKDYDMKSDDKIIIVDGCKWNKNVTDLVGDEICVIDHHQVKKPDDVQFCDIRPDYGACSSILFSYFHENKINIPQNIASALLIGINMDTSLLTRGVSVFDINAYSYLYTLSDVGLVNSILRNYIQQKDLAFYRHAIDNVVIDRGIAFCYFAEGCNQNMLGILGDFFLALKEVEFVFLIAKNDDKLNVSLRNENPKWNCSEIIQTILKGIGFGGGHSDMAGGIINDISLFDKDLLYGKLMDLLS